MQIYIKFKCFASVAQIARVVVILFIFLICIYILYVFVKVCARCWKLYYIYLYMLLALLLPVDSSFVHLFSEWSCRNLSTKEANKRFCSKVRRICPTYSYISCTYILIYEFMVQEIRIDKNLIELSQNGKRQQLII